MAQDMDHGYVTPEHRTIAEYKAPCFDYALIRDRLTHVADFVSTCHQVDTYFENPCGQLKLREESDTGCFLIFRSRSHRSHGPSSRVLRVPIADPRALREVLANALGIAVVIAKDREMWNWDDTLVHLDSVSGLGTFVELEEAVDDPGVLERVLLRLRARAQWLGIPGDCEIFQTYADLAEKVPRYVGDGSSSRIHGAL